MPLIASLHLPPRQLLPPMAHIVSPVGATAWLKRPAPRLGMADQPAAALDVSTHVLGQPLRSR